MRKILTSIFCCFFATTFISQAATSGTCGDNLKWSYNTSTKVLTITGSGAMYDYDGFSETPWDSYAKNITSISLPNGLTTIGKFAFLDCSSITQITIPSKVTSIEKGAFMRCSSLAKVVVSNGLQTIGYAAFAECYSLSSITIPSSVTVIGYGAFQLCYALTSIVIPDGVKKLNGTAFYGCTSLKSVTIGNGVEEIGGEAFAGCQALTSLTIGNKVKDIYDAFYGCKSLVSLVLPNSVELVGASAFEDCSSLKSVTLGSSVSTLGEDAFKYCDALETITCLGEVPPTVNNFYVFPNYNIDVCVPCGCVDAYKANSSWRQFSNLHEPKARYSISIQPNNEKYGKAYVESHSACATVIVAEANEGYKFLRWSDNNTENPRTLTLTKNTTLNAVFSAITYTVSISYDSDEGIVSGGGTYEHGKTATLTATPNEGYEFVRWGDGETINPRKITVTDDLALTAEFKKTIHTITLTCDMEKGSISGGGTYEYGETVTLTAIPNEGYEFVRWSDGETINPRKITVTDDLVLTAEFKKETHTIVLTCDVEKGSVFGGGTYEYGETVTLTATPNEGYKFVRWSNNVVDNPYTFVISKDVTLTAEFEELMNTAVENNIMTTTNQKLLRDGQLIILRDDKTYNVMGQEL